MTISPKIGYLRRSSGISYMGMAPNENARNMQRGLALAMPRQIWRCAIRVVVCVFWKRIPQAMAACLVLWLFLYGGEASLERRCLEEK